MGPITTSNRGGTPPIPWSHIFILWIVHVRGNHHLGRERGTVDVIGPPHAADDHADVIITECAASSELPLSVVNDPSTTALPHCLVRAGVTPFGHILADTDQINTGHDDGDVPASARATPHGSLGRRR